MSPYPGNPNSRPTELCWVLNGPYDIIGGAGNRFRTEVEYFFKSNISVSVICRRSAIRPPVLSSYLRIPTKLLPFFLLELFLRTSHEASRKRRIAFIVHDPISSIPIALASRLFRKYSRTFLVVHGPMSLEQQWLAKSFLKRAIIGLSLLLLETIAYTLVDKLLAVSEYEVNYLGERFGLKDKVHMIRNGIPIERFAKFSRSQFREEVGVGPKEILIVNLGHLYTYRGLSNLLEALSLVRMRASEVARPLLVVVGGEKGSAANYSRYKTEVETFGIEDLVTFVGDRKDIPNILRAADIYAERFSRQVNGIGIAIMEAMAAGLPVITGADWITSRLLHDGKDCLLVKKEDGTAIAEGIIALSQDPMLRKTLGLNAQKTAAALFSVEGMLKQCEHEYIESAFPV